VKEETVAQAKSKRHQAARVQELRDRVSQHQEEAAEGVAVVKSLGLQVQQLADKQQEETRKMTAIKKEHGEEEASATSKLNEAAELEAGAAARAAKGKEELYKAEMSTDTLEKMSHATEAAGLLTATKTVAQLAIKAKEDKVQLQDQLGDIRTAEAKLDVLKQSEKTAEQVFSSSSKKASVSRVELETAEAAVAAAQGALSASKTSVGEAKQSLQQTQRSDQVQEKSLQMEESRAEDTSASDSMQQRADKLSDKAEKANAHVEASTEKKANAHESLSRTETEAKQVELELQPVLKRKEAAAESAARAAEQAHQLLAQLKAKAALAQKQEAEAEAQVQEKSHVVQTHAAEEEQQEQQAEQEPQPWKSQQEIAVEQKVMRQIDAGRQASVALDAQMAMEQKKKVLELEQTLTTRHSKRAPQLAHSDWSAWRCSVDNTQHAQIGVSAGGCHSSLLLHTAGAEGLEGPCAAQFVSVLATHYASALAQYSVDLTTCGSSSEALPGTLDATKHAEEAVIADLKSISMPSNSSAANNTGLMDQVAAVQALADNEGKLNQKVGQHVSDSLKQAEEAMNTILAAKEASMSSQSVPMEHSNWQCKSDSSTTGVIKYSSQPCTASATIQSSVGVGVFNQLGGAFSIQDSESLGAACSAEFRSHAVAQLSHMMLELSQSVQTCGPLSLESDNQPSVALNEHSGTVARELETSQAAREAANPALKQAAIVYRGVVQQLDTAKQERRSLQMLTGNAGSDPAAAAAASAKVDRLSTEAAKLRITYLHETLAADHTN